MDPLTLMISTSLAGLIMAANMGLLYIAEERRDFLLDWSLAGLCFMASSLISAFSLGLHIHELGLLAVGNTLYILGHFQILAGVRCHLGLGARRDWLAAVVFLVLAIHAIPWVQASVLHRMLVLTPLIGVINLAVAYLLWREPKGEDRLSYLPLLVIELFFCLQQVLRGTYVSIDSAMSLDMLDSRFLQMTGSLFVLLFLSVGTMSCSFIVTRHQALALRRAALTDALTGWFNRRALSNIAVRAHQRYQQHDTGLSFIVFDIDHFKRINDSFGHSVGDAAICHVTRLSSEVLRAHDTLFRIGGEEFAILVEGGTTEQVHEVAERLRERIASTALFADGFEVSMTISVGVAHVHTEDGAWEAILRRADEALYYAKNHGRNRVSVHSHGTSASLVSYG
jgi:diguanylate cyclase (GGDEF)-like protein